MSRISWENYEEYMMMHADGELQEAEERELMAFVAQHPQLQAELDEYSAVRLMPDTTIVYANKQALMKEEPVAAPRIIAFPAWRKYSIAAAAMIVLFVSVYKVMNDGNDVDNSNVVAANNSKQTVPVRKEQVAVPVSNTPAPAETPVNTAVAQNSNAVPVEQEQKKQVVKQGPQVVRPEVQVAQQDTKQVVPAHEIAPTPQVRESETPVAQLPVAGVKEIGEQQTTTTAAETRAVPAYAVAQEQVEDKQTFLDKLPVDDIKKKQIGNIANAIKDATESKKWSVKIEKKKLVLSF